jgi:hypothetical protein
MNEQLFLAQLVQRDSFLIAVCPSGAPLVKLSSVSKSLKHIGVYDSRT